MMLSGHAVTVRLEAWRTYAPAILVGHFCNHITQQGTSLGASTVHNQNPATALFLQRLHATTSVSAQQLCMPIVKHAGGHTSRTSGLFS